MMRVVVVPDVHGDLDKAKRALVSAGVVAVDGETWVGGRDVVVQIGDQVDGKQRGAATRAHVCGDSLARDIGVLNYFTDLHRQAASAGGAVHSLIGNHEVMNAAGMMQYADVCPRCAAQRIEAFRPGGRVSSMIARTRTACLQIGELLFVHAGILPEHLDAFGGSLQSINFAASLALSGQRPMESFWEAFMGQDGMLTTRAFSQENPSLTPSVENVLRRTGARHMIVGHNAKNNAASRLHGGRVVVFDPGMSRAIFDAPPQSLVISRTAHGLSFDIAPESEPSREIMFATSQTIHVIDQFFPGNYLTGWRING